MLNDAAHVTPIQNLTVYQGVPFTLCLSTLRYREDVECSLKPTQARKSDNFGFLAEHDPLLVQIAAAAEGAFASDLNTTLIKLRLPA